MYKPTLYIFEHNITGEVVKAITHIRGFLSDHGICEILDELEYVYGEDVISWFSPQHKPDEFVGY